MALLLSLLSIFFNVFCLHLSFFFSFFFSWRPECFAALILTNIRVPLLLCFCVLVAVIRDSWGLFQLQQIEQGYHWSVDRTCQLWSTHHLKTQSPPLCRCLPSLLICLFFLTSSSKTGLAGQTNNVILHVVVTVPVSIKIHHFKIFIFFLLSRFTIVRLLGLQALITQCFQLCRTHEPFRR